MAFFDFLTKNKVRSIINDNQQDQYNSERIGNIEIPLKLTDQNAFKLANSVSEIYFPIDFYADRCSKLRYYLADKSGKEIVNSELNRFITKPNPFYSLNDLIYQYVFSYMSDGNAISYLGVPSTYKGNINVGSIDRVDILQPDLLYLNEYSNLSTLKVSSLNDLIREAHYYALNGISEVLTKDYLRIDKIDRVLKLSSNILSRSPLFKASKSIDLLLAVYSARYNVYANNGAAGYLVKKSGGANDAMAAAVSDVVNRQSILDEIKNRDGLTGSKNIWGISSVPIEFVKTLATISELMPLDETLENAIKIASVWQIPPELCPRKDQSTFNNKDTSEKTIWENGLISMVNTVCDNFTKIFTLDKQGISIKADFSSVSCLKTNESMIEDTLTKKINNNTILYEKGIITYNQFLTEIDKQPIDGGDRLIFDMTKTPYAVKLGVGGTQAMQMVLTDQYMTDEMKKNTLIVIFGLSEIEANQIITKK